MKRITYTLLVSAVMALSVPATYAIQGGGSGGAGGGDSSAEMSRDFRGEVPKYGVPNQSGCCYVKDADNHPTLQKKQHDMMNRGLLKDR